MSKHMKTDKAYGFAVYKTNNATGQREWLLIQHQAGHWSFPKGHAEGKETPYEAACRELQEETGLIIGEDVACKGERIFTEHYVMQKKGQWYDKTVAYWLGQCVSEVQVHIQLEEVQAYQWVAENDVAGVLTFDAVRALWYDIKISSFE